MSLKKELEAILHDEDKILELSTEGSFRKLSKEDQDDLRQFFQFWVEVGERESLTISGVSLVALGFILGHNWVKEHWVLW